jgi:predicted DNA-binding protein YlxM (UPF0122 family)
MSLKRIIHPTKEEIILDYFDNQLSTVDIAKKYNISKGSIYNLFKEYDLQARSNAQSQAVLRVTGKREVMIGKRESTMEERYGVRSLTHPKNFKGMTIDGVRFRSSWEILVAKYFNANKIEWVFEPRLFKFPTKTKPRSYTPDFKLLDLDIWLEVKGRIYDTTDTTMLRFKEYYPEEFSKLRSITHYPGCLADKKLQESGIMPFYYIKNIMEEK